MKRQQRGVFVCVYVCGCVALWANRAVRLSWFCVWSFRAIPQCTNQPGEWSGQKAFSKLLNICNLMASELSPSLALVPMRHSLLVWTFIHSTGDENPGQASTYAASFGMECSHEVGRHWSFYTYMYKRVRMCVGDSELYNIFFRSLRSTGMWPTFLNCLSQSGLHERKPCRKTTVLGKT